MLMLRSILVASLFVLLVALCFAGLLVPVNRIFVSFYSTSWTGEPGWLFEMLWVITTLALSTSLVAALFWLIGLAKKRIWPAI